jgi:hypothetical protein
MYVIDLNMGDIAFCKACVLGVVRRMQGSTASEQTQISFTTAAAECLTRLNEARMDTRDVMFLCACLQKTTDLLLKDRGLSPLQRVEAQQQCESIQNKLTGEGVQRTVLDA